MKKFGLIGYPLSHSFSGKYFQEKFEKEGLTDCSYELFPLETLSDFEKLITSNPDLCGLNVTIPHKIGVMFYLDKIDPAAKAIDAVNCIKIIKQKPVESFFTGELSSTKVRLEGFNTDCYGFENSLKPLLKKHHNKALVLGSGGSSRAVAYALSRLGIDYKIVSRRKARKQITYSDINRNLMSDRLLIINTTPLGLSPAVETYPDIPYEYITSNHLLYDLIYNPDETEFLKRGKEMGATIKNGEEMLHLQAERSWEIWNNG
ncbi:shikimate dehydrogenase [Arcticibacter tournemirensis]|uniref:Shikimate dehydrogenase n=1 Tax=Arcticibacter tournemirensis TaxID=699437 RepID=A0A5M9HKJ7_9SPHI|nr:shikimate dehydrogenase [Arcticibacter tournemirensis]KAA8485517.1 shikimate dehydrogenase [Arcticibacter tournemirensis]TQM48773.1 shikimate dehydrogenase [Arcticibacter tournemirensis]